MSYWNPSTNPNQNYLNPHPLSGQAIYNQNYNAIGNQLMTQIAPQNAAMTEQEKGWQTLTGLQNQQVDVRTADANAQNNLQSQVAGIRLAGVPDEKAWRTQLKNLAEQQYNVDVGGAQQGYSESLRNLYSRAGANATLTTPGARRSRGELQAQLELSKQGANINLQTAYANNTHYQQQLDQDAKIYGLTRDQLQAGMQNALKAAGLEKQVNLAQLAADMRSNDVKRADNASSVWQQLALYANSPAGNAALQGQQNPAAQSPSLGHKVMQEQLMPFGIGGGSSLWGQLQHVHMPSWLGGSGSPWSQIQGITGHTYKKRGEVGDPSTYSPKVQAYSRLLDMGAPEPAAAAYADRYQTLLNDSDQKTADQALGGWLSQASAAGEAGLPSLTGGTNGTASAIAQQMNSLVNQVFPVQPQVNPVQLMNAQSQFMAPYLSHLQNMAPETKAAYAQQAMTFPLAYQIQQQVSHNQNVNDLRSQALGGLLGQYYSNQASSAASPDLLAGSTGQ